MHRNGNDTETFSVAPVATDADRDAADAAWAVATAAGLSLRMHPDVRECGTCASWDILGQHGAPGVCRSTGKIAAVGDGADCAGWSRR